MSDSSSAFPSSSRFLQVLPSAIPAQQWAGLWMQFLRSAQCFIRTPRTPDQKHFPGLCTGRWPNLAELVHCPFSIVTNSPVLSLGRSTLDPQKGLWLCLESSTAAWGRASSHIEGPEQIKTHQYRSQCSQSCMGAHVHTRNSPILGATSKGQEAFPCHTTDLKHNRVAQGPLVLRGLWTMELFRSSSIPINLIALDTDLSLGLQQSSEPSTKSKTKENLSRDKQVTKLFLSFQTDFRPD